jgi:hypothetical protein
VSAGIELSQGREWEEVYGTGVEGEEHKQSTKTTTDAMLGMQEGLICKGSNTSQVSISRLGLSFLQVKSWGIVCDSEERVLLIWSSEPVTQCW